MSNLACVLWWLVPGVFLGWLASWLFDMLFFRNGRAFVETAKADLDKANARVDALTGELTGAKGLVAKQSGDLNRLNSELSFSRTAHEETHAKLGLIQTDLDGRMANLNHYATENAALQGQLQNARAAYEAAERTSAGLKAEAAGATSSTSAARAELDAAKAAFGALQGELQTAKSAAATLRQERDVAQAASAKLTGDIEAVKRQAAAYQADLATTQKSGSEVTGEVARLRAELAAAHAAHEATKSSYASLSGEIDTTKQSASGAMAEIASLKAMLDGAKIEKDRSLGLLQKDVAEHKSALAASQADAETVKAELANARAKADELAKLKLQFADLTTSYQASRTSSDRIKVELDAATADLVRIKGDVATSRAQIEEREHMIALLQAEIEGNKRTQAALGNRVADIEMAAHLENERRILMTRYGFVPRVRDRDDLTLVEGIGPKIEELLLTAGINSHSKLAVASHDELQRALDAGGSAFNRANPGTWARQAALIVKGDFAELRRWQDVLVAGVEIPTKQS